MDSCLGSAVQSCCGEGGALQTNITGTVFQPHWVCPHSQRVCFPRPHFSGSNLLYREWTLSCVHFPSLSHSGSGSRGYSTKAQTWLGCVFCLPCLSSSDNQELDECTLPRCSAPYSLCGPSLTFRVHWSGMPRVSSGELISGSNPPGGCQPSRISGSLWFVVPKVQIPEREERRPPRQCNWKKRGSSLLTRARALCCIQRSGAGQRAPSPSCYTNL